jgi:hypothetical protein
LIAYHDAMSKARTAIQRWGAVAGRRLPARVLALALSLAIALPLAHAAERPGRHRDEPPPTSTEAPPRTPPPGFGMREPPRGRAGVSMDQAIAQVERRYKARVVRAEQAESNGRRIYVLRLLSEEGRVWTVRVDAETGGVN